ncbi:MAG: F0F1 ATP synthase subunit A [Candidatus Rokubacteria bacterium]|nr:F0F1 ATP synthase subunit A [Candidatus Rokubacteria bacterium]
MEHPPIFRLPGVPDHVTYTWIIMIVLVAFAVAAARRRELVPVGLQNFGEVVLETFVGLVDELIGPDGRRFLPLVATLGIFILVGNLMGLIPGLMSPTASLNTTAACAIIVFLTYHWIGIRTQGAANYLKHFMGPVLWLAPLMFPIEIIGHLARPLSLSLRLFGNMTGGHILLAAMFFLMGLDGLLGWALSGSAGGLIIGLPAGILMFVFILGFLVPLKILVSIIQAFVFVLLTCLYIAGALEEAEHHAEAHAQHH